MFVTFNIETGLVVMIGCVHITPYARIWRDLIQYFIDTIIYNVIICYNNFLLGKEIFCIETN